MKERKIKERGTSYTAVLHLDGDHEVLEHLAGPLLDLDGELGRPVHEHRDLAELGLLHAAGGEGGGADADASRGHGRPVTLRIHNRHERKEGRYRYP